MPHVDPPAASTVLLLRRSQAAVSAAVTAAVGAAALPQPGRSGTAALAAVARGATSAAEVARLAAMSRQDAAKAVTVLDAQGLLVRGVDRLDARRKPLMVTDRGAGVLDAVAEAVATVAAGARRRVPPAVLSAMWAGLDAVAAHGLPPKGHTTARCFAAEPVVPVGDLDEGLRHYRQLGFSLHEAVASRGLVTLHLAVGAGPVSVRLAVDDAEALFVEWARAALAGTTRITSQGVEGGFSAVHVDPWGNGLHFGGGA